MDLLADLENALSSVRGVVADIEVAFPTVPLRRHWCREGRLQSAHLTIPGT
jgi:hypothetical protein